MKLRTTILFPLLIALVATLFVIDVAVGDVHIPLRDTLDVLKGGGDEMWRDIIIEIRLIKAIVALLCGAALSVGGLQMQTLFRNPLAGPYVLGVSAGASLGVALFLIGAPMLGAAAQPVMQHLGTASAAWLGSALTLLAILLLARRIKDIMVVLILGMMFTSAIGAVVEMLQYFGTESALKSYVVWTMGSLGNVTYEQLYVIAPVVGAGLLLAVVAIKPMNMLLFGEQYARTMGLNVGRTRLLLLLSTTLLAGTVTAFCGPIGFVGLAVPHMARMLFASADHRTLVPASALLGASMLLAGDITAKYFTLPIKTVTALMGIPMVIYIVLRKKTLMQ